MKRFLSAAFAASVVLILASGVALAAPMSIDVGLTATDHAIILAQTTAPETIAQATGETTKVTWAWGAAVQQWAGAIGSIILASLMWALRQLPAQAVAFLSAIRIEQLLQKGIDYGINAVVGATKDKKLSVDVGNQVLAEALQYVIDSAPGWLIGWAGGPEQIARKIWARLDLDESADAGAVEAIASSVAKPS